MNALMVQCGSGMYARVQPAMDGMLVLEYGEVAGGGFYPATRAQRVHAPFWDGAGWHPEVMGLVSALRPNQAKSTLLERMLAAAQEKARIAPLTELQKTLQLVRKTQDDWATISEALQRGARTGLIARETVERFSRDVRLPDAVRQQLRDVLSSAS